MAHEFKFFVIVVCMFFAMAFNANAQWRWGAEAGVNISHGAETCETKAGFNLGVVGEFSFAKNWFVDGALKLSSQPCENRFMSNGYLPTQNKLSYSEWRYTPYYITLPLRIGYKFTLCKQLDLSVAAGPMVGVGLWGRGHATLLSFTDGNQLDAPHVVYDQSVKNVFAKDQKSFSSSRFEYGANARIGLTLLNHYRFGFDYSILIIPGMYRAVDRVNLYSLSIGYMF